MRRGLARRTALLALAALAVAPLASAGAQCTVSGEPTKPPLPPACAPRVDEAPSLGRRDAVNAGINVALGALTAGLRAWHADRPVVRAALGGAVGGAVAYGGRRVVASRGRWSGLAGRQLGAVGASIVRNAGDGRAPLAGVVLPLGPVRLYVNEPQADGSTRLLQPRLDLAGTVAMLSLATRADASIDRRGSLEAGAPVVVGMRPTPGPLRAGTHRGGVVGLVDLGRPHAEVERTLAHELVHVTQYDFTYIALASPLERALWRRAPSWLAPVGQWVDLGLNQPVWGVLNGVIPYRDRPWEREAHLMTDR